MFMQDKHPAFNLISVTPRGEKQQFAPFLLFLLPWFSLMIFWLIFCIGVLTIPGGAPIRIRGSSFSIIFLVCSCTAGRVKSNEGSAFTSYVSPADKAPFCNLNFPGLNNSTKSTCVGLSFMWTACICDSSPDRFSHMADQDIPVVLWASLNISCPTLHRVVLLKKEDHHLHELRHVRQVHLSVGNILPLEHSFSETDLYPAIRTRYLTAES